MNEIVIHLIWAGVVLVAIATIWRALKVRDQHEFQSWLDAEGQRRAEVEKKLDGLREITNENMKAVVNSVGSLEERLRAVENAL